MVHRARDFQPGERLPGTVYEVVRLIGAGGMGTVYDVEDTTIGKRYVLKTLHPQLGNREDLARRMQSEARTLARLNHPNIVEVITAGVTGDELRLPFFVMERLNGQSLRVVLEKKGQLELPHAYHIGIDLLDALDHAHDKGVIHRDVKPDNIFLHRTPANITLTKLLDFGVQSLLDSSVRDTGGRFLGTLRYAAPEQLNGEKPTPAVDVYAAGLVLYEMVAGCGPFDDEGDPKAIGAAHMHKRPPPLSRFAFVPREFETLVMAALAKHPAARPRDAFSFAASLRNLKRRLSDPPPSVGAPDQRPSASPTPAPAAAEPAEAAAPAAREAPRATATTPRPRTPSSRALRLIDRNEPPLRTPPAAAPAPLAETTLRWPLERTVATSDDPQVQLLATGPLRPGRSGTRVVAAVALVALVTTGGLAVARRRALSKAAASGATLVLPAPSAAPPASAAPSAMGSPEAGAEPVEAAPAASSQAKPAPAASASSSKKKKPHLDRPGPGF